MFQHIYRAFWQRLWDLLIHEFKKIPLKSLAYYEINSEKMSVAIYNETCMLKKIS